MNVPNTSAPALTSQNDFKVPVEEQVPGSRDDQDLAFVASGNTFTDTYDGIRITYNNDSSEADYINDIQ